MTQEEEQTSRAESTLIAGEREQLEAFLEDNRDELIWAVEGLSDEQARRRLVPSLTTPITLLKHAAAVERVWFQRSLAGRSVDEIDGLVDGSEISFVVRDDETIDMVLAEYRAAAEESRRIAASYEMDELAQHNRRGPLTLRWVYVHMVEELARHAGHADILREQILAEEA
jgi:uncharacterized damage-inducible protein DinB